MADASSNELLEGLIEQCGGMGRLQWFLLFIVQTAKITPAWSMMMMSFAGSTPKWWCAHDGENRSLYSVSSNDSSFQACTYQNQSCDQFIFDTDMSTTTSQWELICDRRWISSTIATIQMFGVLVGAAATGHIADLIGRKPTFFATIVLLIVLNVIAYFSSSWQMFAVMRFLIGVACGGYLTVYFTYIVEFVGSKWRTLIVAIPAWSLEVGLFGVAAWLIRDWALLHIASAVVVSPFLLSWWHMPESFRWLAARGRFDEAEKVVTQMARFNKRPVPDMSKVKALMRKEQAETQNITSKKYTVRDLFRTWRSTKLTLVQMFMWFGSGYSYYSINFGVQALYGDLFLNLFLVGIVEVPAQVMVLFFNNRIGRKWTCVLFFALSGVCAFVVATSPHFGTTLKGEISNGFALASKMAMGAAWAAMMVFTTELYPTVVRNISYGKCSVAARVGTMIAPQIVFLNESLPGLTFYLIGAIMLATALISTTLVETRNMALPDMMLPVSKGQADTEVKARASLIGSEIIL